MSKSGQELRDERDPVPNRCLAFEIVELGRQSAFSIVETQQPENSSKKLSRLCIFEKTSSLQVAA